MPADNELRGRRQGLGKSGVRGVSCRFARAQGSGVLGGMVSRGYKSREIPYIHTCSTLSTHRGEPYIHTPKPCVCCIPLWWNYVSGPIHMNYIHALEHTCGYVCYPSHHAWRVCCWGMKGALPGCEEHTVGV